jgi:hypothetical protein
MNNTISQKLQSSEKKHVILRLIGLIACLAVLSIVYITNPSLLIIKPDVYSIVLPVLSLLFAVALFMERSIAVFLSAWRSGGADVLDEDIRAVNKNIANLKKLIEDGKIEANIKEYSNQLEENESRLSNLLKNRIEYRAVSRQIAIWLGLGFGLLISSAGIRILSAFITEESLAIIVRTTQGYIFSVVDVLLTGSVLAGGTGAINKLMKVYYSFTTKTADKINNPKEDNPSAKNPGVGTANTASVPK